MRVTPILTAALIALAAASCARQQASYYAVDPATQQPVAQPQAVRTAHQRGLFSSPQLAQQSYAQAPYGRPAYRPPAPPAQQEPPSSGRGLFNTYAANQTRYPPPAYQQQTNPQQSYRQQRYPQQAQQAQPPAVQPRYPRRGYAQPGYARQQPAYARRRAPAQYQQPSYGTGGPYVAARSGNPFAAARWY